MGDTASHGLMIILCIASFPVDSTNTSRDRQEFLFWENNTLLRRFSSHNTSGVFEGFIDQLSFETLSLVSVLFLHSITMH